MNKFFLIFFLTFLVGHFSGQSQTTYTFGKVKNPNFNYLKKYNDKYPYEVKLFSNSLFTNRVKKLVGNRYSLLKRFWNVEIPMEIRTNKLIASACQQHNCSSTKFIIIYDFENDKMFAGFREEDKVTLYSEGGKYYPDRLQQWANNDY